MERRANLKKLIIPKITIISLFSFAIMLFMFLGATDFINRYYYCVYIAFLFFVITPQRKFYINGTFLLLVFFSMSIMIFNPESHKTFTNMIRPFTYPICYFMGLNVFNNRKSSSQYDLGREEKNLRGALYLMTAGFAVHFFLNMFTNMDATDRNVVDFWTGKVMSATGQATLACLLVGIIAAFLFSNSGKKKKILAIILLVAIVWYNLVLAGRTLFIFIVLMFVLAFLFRSIVTKKKIFSTLFVLLLIFAAVLMLYNMNAFGIKTAFENSNFYDRFFGGKYSQDIDSDKRGEYKLEYLKHFFDHPFGGRNIYATVGHSAHDLYLDSYDESGIFTLIAIVAFIVVSLSHMFQFIKLKVASFETRQLVFCTYIIVNIQFWLEPIMRGMPWLLATYCFIDGVLTNVLKKEKNH